MHDPFPLAPPLALQPLVGAVARRLSLHTLPLHWHEVVLAFLLYHATFCYAAPAISRALVPRQYAAFDARTRLNWNVHVVSLTQSTLICSLALWTIRAESDRADMGWAERVHGYTGAGGLVQAFAGGYFVWDLVVTLRNLSMFGPGMLAHAVSALFVFSLGFRPFVNYYGPVFILYELSSPFLNVHWFCDKMHMTGSRLQLYNGIVLLCTFFSCRLAWGSYQSLRVFYDVYRALTVGGELSFLDPAAGRPALPDTGAGTMRFAGDRSIPLWLAACYLGANLTLNGLNWYWFGKMIETIRRRFDPPLGTRRSEETRSEKRADADKVLVEGTHVDTPPPSLPTTPYARTKEPRDYVGAVRLDKGRTHLEAEQVEVRQRGQVSGSRPVSSARAA